MSFAVQPPALGDIVGVAQRGDGGGLRQRVDVEWLAHPVHQIGDGRIHDAVPDAQRRESVRLGKGSRHDQVRIPRQPVDCCGLLGGLEEFVVRLVQHDDHIPGHACDERFDSGTREPGSRRIVRIRNEYDPCSRRDCRAHRVEVVGMILGGDFDATRTPRLRRKRVHDERVAANRRRASPGRRNACVASSSTSLLPLPSTICSGRYAQALRRARSSARTRCRRDSA